MDGMTVIMCLIDIAACLLVFHVAVTLFSTTVAAPRANRQPWTNPCFDYRHAESGAIEDMIPR